MTAIFEHLFGRLKLSTLVVWMGLLASPWLAHAQTSACGAGEVAGSFAFGGANTWPSGTTSRSFGTGSAPANVTLNFQLTPVVAYVAPYPALDTLSTTPNSLEIDHNGTLADVQLSTMVIGFSRQVSKLRFVAMDIDSVVDGSNRFRDQIVVSAVNGASAVTPAMTAVNSTRVLVSGGTATAALDGGNCTSAQTLCNVTVDFVQPVTTVTVLIRAGPGTGNNITQQATAYNTFGFCVPVPDYALTKSTAATLVRGATPTFTFTASNTGLSAVTAGQTITVKDILPAGLTFVSPAVTGGANAAAWSCTLGTTSVANDTATCASSTGLAPGGSSVFTLAVSVASGATSPLTNRAKIFGGGDPLKPAEASTGAITACTAASEGQAGGGANAGCAFEQSAVASQALLSITKTDGTGTRVAGSTTTYTIVASNTGPSPANGTTVRDPAATGLNCNQVTCSATGGAACPAGITVAGVQAGVAVPTFPANSGVTFQLTCGVTATGQ